MLKDTTYCEKFSSLKMWMPYIAESIKKELKNEHLKNDPQFLKKYFPGKHSVKLTTKELAEGYSRAIEEGQKENIAEAIANQWLLKHGELYNFFDGELRKVHPEIDLIETIEKEKEIAIADGAVSEFGALDTYIFSTINSVAFSAETFELLRQQAESALQQKIEKQSNHQEHLSVEKAKRDAETQIARLTDKYEKKIQGLTKKYNKDTESLKKQISTLHKQLNSK